jgi:hypothetical protein
MRTILAALLLWLAIPGPAQTCEAGSEKDRQETKEVRLLTPSDAPAYYFRVSHYAFLIPADKFVAYVEARQWGSAARERLLVELKKDPVVSRADLFKYILADGRNLLLIEHSVADLVEKGSAALVDVWELTEPERIVPSVKVITTTGSCAYQGREFLSPKNELLLQVTDSIA